MDTFKDSLQKLSDKNNKLAKSLSLIEVFYNSGDFEKTINELYNMVRISEDLTERARVLPIFTGYPKAKEDVSDIVIDSLGIKINYNDNVLHIHMNSLLPKKEKEKARAGYIRASSIMAFDKYYKQHQFEVIDEPVVVIFKHNYSIENRQWRDHDNIETNVVMDAIALYFLTDDTSKTCDNLHFSQKSNENSTDIFIVLQKELINWLAKNYK